MHEITFRDPVVIDAAASYRALRVDIDVQKTIAKTYRVSLLPTLLFLDGKGDEILRLQGYVPPNRLQKIMKMLAVLLHASRSNDQIRSELAQL